MSLAAGTKLGLYQILAPIGAGGMGEVYRARDTKLGRDVAIKVLPHLLANDPERLARFEREAKVLASLNHPNIAQIYGIEDRALVMELVEGETLHGPLPLDQALRIAGQICDALEAAHEKGITHRDLKPANIMITPAGVVKVLDFGLAAVASASAGDSGDAANSPTLTMSPTHAGMILGTAAYMSPEQARGKTVDKRADIWAFGVVLYEMLTGKPLFEGDTVSDILAGVLKEQPDLERVPVEVRRLLRRCLEKEPKRRLRDIGDAMELVEVGQAQGVSSTGPAPALQRWPWIVAAVFALAALALGFIHFREKAPVEQSLRYQIPPPGATVAQHMALSPDGRHLAFVANNGGPTQVWVRAMDTLEARPLASTDGASYPFWSPDGAYLGFFTEGKLKKIAIAGGPPQTLCDATTGRGGTWNRDGMILFSPGPGSVIFRVSAAGGIPSPVTKLPQNGSGAGHRFPAFLPDGVHFLYNAGSDKPDAAGLFVGSLDGDAAIRLLPDVTNALYAAPITPGGTAHLLFRRENTLMAQPFDAKGLKTTGEMFPVAEQVPISENVGFGAFSVSENGVLVYRSGGAVSNRELVWLDRAGKRLGAVGKPGEFGEMAVSPDEKTLAVGIGGASESDIWLQDMGRGVLSRFTFRPGINRGPVWSPDGSRLVFALQALSTYSSDIYQKPAGGNGQEELLVHAGINGFPEDWSPDGKWIVYQQTGQKTANDLWLLPLDGDRKPVSYLQTPFDELNARFSPDGGWMAYQSNESGRFQIYVQTVPPSGAKYQISSSGGAVPQWRRDGKELFYVAADQKLTAVPVKLGTTVEAGTPQPLFPVFPIAASYFFYVPMRDGQRFLVNVPAGGEGAAVQPITVVTNWQRSLSPQSR